MTNGEKIRVMFPSMIVGFITESQIGIYFVKNQHSANVFDLDWWNAEYKEPTTNNDLGVDCVSRQFMYDLGATCIATRNGNGKLIALGAIEELPSVTPQEPRWIPVSERLPQNKETVLVTFKHFVSGNTIGLGSVILLRGKPHWHVREQNLGTYDVLAWMPLPKPYEPQESEG